MGAREHRHAASTSARRPFTGPVGLEENPKAHGGYTVVKTCRCGAVEIENRNQGHVELSGWIEPAQEREHP